jgi:SPP1 family predicted phage head-tail adaptor
MRLTFIDPGQLRHEMQLETQIRTADGSGGFTESWQAVATVFAHIEPVSAAQSFIGAQDREAVTHRITMRHRTNVKSGMRLAKGGRHFRLVTVRDPDETGRFLLCLTEEMP